MSWQDVLLGRPLASYEENEQRVGVSAGIPMLGLDALGSAAYGPEAALTLLLPLGVLGLAYIGQISMVIIALLLIVYFSYRQTIAAYPTGGGSYTVARENLGTFAGLLAAAALLLDYVLVVAVGISAGVGALVSAIPQLQPYVLHLCLGILGIIALVNLRGVRESGIAFMIPTYLFVVCMFTVLALGVIKTLANGGHPIPVAAPPALPAAATTVSLWLLLQAFASGCTAMTGVEAVSNGVTAFREPAAHHARRTLAAIIATLAILLAGIAFLSQAYDIGATEPGVAGYQSVLSQLVAAVVGRGAFYYITIGSILAVLAFSANTGFADFPRLCRVMAHDGFLPHAFASRGRRLVFSQGILTLMFLSGALLIIFDGITDRLIPLFAVGAFLAFTLSQAGMVVHWRRLGGQGAHRSMLINGLGATATAITLVIILVAKFTHGAWITLLLLPTMLYTFLFVRQHYNYVAQETVCHTPLNVTGLRPPLVIVPVRGWSTLARKALRFALKLSPEVCAVQIWTGEEESNPLPKQWTEYVEAPTIAAGLKPPELQVIYSPYRHLFTPLINYILQVKDENPERNIAVVISELVEHRWYHYLLHNQRAEALKLLLLLRGDERIVIVNVPWYLKA
jgi:amino acid transporter